MYGLGDETVVEAWRQNPYYQYFCGMSEFQWEVPCDPSDLVYFRRRIGETGVALILAATARLHGKKSLESEVVVDTTVQEKNVTYPVDTKLYRKVIVRCWREADRHGVKLRRRYAKEVRRCVQVQRWRKDPRKTQACAQGPAQAAHPGGPPGAGVGTQAAVGSFSFPEGKLLRSIGACSASAPRIGPRSTPCTSRMFTASPRARSIRNTSSAPKLPW